MEAVWLPLFVVALALSAVEAMRQPLPRHDVFESASLAMVAEASRLNQLVHMVLGTPIVTVSVILLIIAIFVSWYWWFYVVSAKAKTEASYSVLSGASSDAKCLQCDESKIQTRISLEEQFDAAVKRAQETLSATGSKISSEEGTLVLYGLFKQAQNGDVTTSRPWSYKRRLCAKWDHWNSMKGMSKADAMAKYVEVVDSLWAEQKSTTNSEPDELQLARVEFDNAAEAISKAGYAGSVQLSNESLLKLYALYRQATEGDVKGSQPYAWNVKRRAMWDAWAGAAGLSQRVAMRKYVETVTELLAVV